MPTPVTSHEQNVAPNTLGIEPIDRVLHKRAVYRSLGTRPRIGDHEQMSLGICPLPRQEPAAIQSAEKACGHVDQFKTSISHLGRSEALA